MRAMRGGDARAFDVFYERHRDWVVSLALRFSASGEDALDVMQETFAYFLRKLPSLELTCRARTFLYPAVKHLSLSRRAAARRLEPLDPAADPPARPEADPDLREQLEARLQGLTEGEREVVLLRFADDFDLKEIAEALAIPLGTVKSRLHGALEKLRARWESPQGKP